MKCLSNFKKSSCLQLTSLDNLTWINDNLTNITKYGYLDLVWPRTELLDWTKWITRRERYKDLGWPTAISEDSLEDLFEEGQKYAYCFHKKICLLFPLKKDA